MKNLYEVVEHAAGQWPDRIALVQNERVLTFDDVRRAIGNLADALTAKGVEPGENVGIVFPRGIDYVLACFAVLKTGAIAVPISAALKAPEIAAAATAVDIDTYCCHDNFISTLADATGAAKESFTKAPSFAGAAVARLSGLRDSVNRARLLDAHTAYICFSSGTTAASKGIVLSHDALWERAARRADAPRIGAESRILWLRALDRFVPNQIVAGFMEGARIIIGNSLNLRSVSDAIQRHRVNQVWAVPSFYRASLQDAVTPADFAAISYFLSSGAPVSMELAQAFHDKFGREILQNYGSTECSPIFINPGTDPRKRGSVGMPVAGREARLRPLESGSGDETCEGELMVRGVGMLSAYYKPWRSREELLEDGWLPTGDIARRDEDGFYWIVGRIKEVINVGGTKVFANELEEILAKHPLVEDCVVFGARDRRFGEVPYAKVKLRDGVAVLENDLLDYANKQLSVFKSLRRLEFVERIEKTLTGKPKRWLYRVPALLTALSDAFLPELNRIL